MNNQMPDNLLGDRNFGKYAAQVEKNRINNILSPSDNNTNDTQAFTALVNGLEGVVNSINKQISDISKLQSNATAEDQKIYAKMSETQSQLREVQTKLSNSSDPKKNAEYIKQIDALFTKMSKFANRDVKQAADNMYNSSQAIIDAGLSYEKIMNRSSETLSQALSGTAQKIRNDMMSVWTAFNVDKLVTGGKSLDQMRDLQKNTKIALNIDNSEFASVQSSLLNQNAQINAQIGTGVMSLNDMTSYLENIKEYSFQNYDQAQRNYKQITLATKYLGLSSASISSLNKTVNSMNNQNYMNQQLSMLAALSNDSSTAEDIDSMSRFLSTNALGVNARYNNSMDIMKSSASVKAASDKYLGDNSSLLTGFMSDVMNGDYATLNEKYGSLLSTGGINENLISQMQSGNLDMTQITTQLMNALGQQYQFAEKSGVAGDEYFKSLGLDANWYNMAYSYMQNQQGFSDTVKTELGVLNSANLTGNESMEELKKITAQNDTTTWFEKLQNTVTTFFGLSNRNWSDLLGLQQFLGSMFQFFTAVTSIDEVLQLKAIKNIIALKYNYSGSPSLLGKVGSFLTGKSALTQTGGALAQGSIGAGLLGGGLIAAGGIAGIHDAITTKDWQGGAARGFFRGTSNSQNTVTQNAGAVLGNTGKWAAIGAGIGTIFPGIGTAIGAGAGAIAGLIEGLIGSSLDKETDALEKNTKALGKSTDTMATNSAMAYLYSHNGGIGATDAHVSGMGGVSSGSTSNAYPWTVTSPYGMRELQPGKKSFHHGIDFGVPTGTVIGSAVSGRVFSTQYDPRNTYPNGPTSGGTGVKVLGSDGKYYTYWHLSNLGVKKGDQVNPGTVIGLSGNTGYSTGPHLHFEVDSGLSTSTSLDPNPYITSALFQASGKSWTPTNISASNASASSNTLSTQSSESAAYLSKESLFATEPSGQGDVTTSSSNTTSYATSDDIDRLIGVITQLSDAQNDQKEFMKALAGKNTFVYGR